MKIKLFTHTDLDGVGCYIVMKSLWGEGHTVDVSYCDYDKINDRVLNFITNKTDTKVEDYDYVFITDISVNEEVAAKLDEVNKGDMTPFVQLLDHHATAGWLNKYEWAFVSPIERGRPGRKSSGTSIIIDFFTYQRPGFERKPSVGLNRFSEKVRRWDTWEWTTHYNDVEAKELNDYLYMVGREKFVQLMLATIPSNDGKEAVYFDASARAILDQKQVEIKAYIEKKNKQLVKCNSKDRKFGFVFAEQYISELGNELAKLHTDLDFIAMADLGEGKLSFRTIREDLDLGQLAKQYGGGGHPKAAGAPIDEEKITEFLFGLF